MRFLGHEVSESGITPDKEKTEPLTGRPAPLDADDLRTFLGMASYYRDHIDDYTAMTKPLHELLRPDA